MWPLWPYFDADFGVDEWHGTNAFVRDGDRISSTYFVSGRGDDSMGSTCIPSPPHNVETTSHDECAHEFAAATPAARCTATRRGGRRLNRVAQQPWLTL